MKYLFILLSLFLLNTLHTDAQTFTVTGTVQTVAGKGVANATVTLKNTGYATTCDSMGNYQLKTVSPGSYNINVSAVGYKAAAKNVRISNDIVINVTLEEDIHVLNNVDVKGEKEKTFGVTRLKAVEGTNINAGKKSEVIVLDDINANKSTNNTRQIYGKVSGLNIWESDGAGMQLSIGGRGLDPNRVSNFNTRQNGYDISADALGYPESYYTPPAEVLDRIEVVRGAASLQYGTQFGGILNFRMKSGVDTLPVQVSERLSIGSWGFFNTSTSIGGTVGQLNYYAFFQHKSGNGWRPNSQFNVNTGYGAAVWKPGDRFKVTVQYTHMDYLEHQPGGLNDAMFATDPQLSTKSRNWFKVDWELGAVLADYAITDQLALNSRFFGLWAERSALGAINTVNDPGGPRNYRTDTYTNWGNESRLIYNWNVNKEQPFVLLGGVRYYHGYTNREIGLGNQGSGGAKSDFAFDKSNEYDSLSYSQYKFPNHNLSLFAENIFR